MDQWRSWRPSLKPKEFMPWMEDFADQLVGLEVFLGGWGQVNVKYPDTPCSMPYMPISWGGLGGQCKHIWQSHGVS